MALATSVRSCDVRKSEPLVPTSSESVPPGQPSARSSQSFQSGPVAITATRTAVRSFGRSAPRPVRSTTPVGANQSARPLSIDTASRICRYSNGLGRGDDPPNACRPHASAAFAFRACCDRDNGAGGAPADDLQAMPSAVAGGASLLTRGSRANVGTFGTGVTDGYGRTMTGGTTARRRVESPSRRRLRRVAGRLRRRALGGRGCSEPRHRAIDRDRLPGSSSAGDLIRTRPSLVDA